MKKFFGKQFEDNTKKPDFETMTFENVNLKELDINSEYKVEYLWVNKDYGYGHSVSVMVDHKGELVGIYLPSHLSKTVIEEYLNDEDFVEALQNGTLYLAPYTYDYETKSGKKTVTKTGYSANFFENEVEENEEKVDE